MIGVSLEAALEVKNPKAAILGCAWSGRLSAKVCST